MSPTRRMRGALLAVGLTSAAALAWVAVRPPGLDPTPSAAPADPADDGGGAITKTASACDFRAGDSWVVHQTMVSDVLVDRQALSGHVFGAVARLGRGGTDEPTQHTRSSAVWDLRVTVARADPAGGGILALQMVDVAQESAAGADGSALQGDLTPPFLLALGPRCELQRFGWRRDADVQGARTQQELVANYVFELPIHAEPGRYQGAGLDAVGQFRHRSVLGQTAHGFELRRRKSDYTTLHHDAHQGMQIALGGNGLGARLPAGRWHDALQLTESIAYRVGGERVAEATVTMTSRHSDVVAAALDVDVRSERWQWGELLSKPALAEAETDEDADLRGIAFDDIVAEFAARLDDPSSNTGLIDRARRWIRANPRALGAMADWIRARATGSERDKSLCRIFFAALGASGLAEARGVLRTFVLDGEFYEPLRVDAAMSLATARNFGRDDLDALLALSRERRLPQAGSDLAGYPAASGAALLGAAVRSLRKTGDPQVAGPLASEAIAAIREQIGPNSTPQQQAGALMGAGNAGAVELYDAVEPLLHDPSESVRELAVRALRLMPAEKALPTLTAQLGAESSDLVRVAVLQALISQSELADGKLPAETVQAVLDSLAGRQSSGVRMALLRLLGDAAAHVPAAKAALVAQFQAELAKGNAADSSVLRMIGRHVDANTLVTGAASPPGS